MTFNTLKALLSCAMLLWPLSSQAVSPIEPRTIVVAYEDDSPPYMFKNQRGEVDGFGIATKELTRSHLYR